MSKRSDGSTRKVFFLTEDGIRAPYESALEATGFEIEWFSELASLSKQVPRRVPAGVVVDLDALTRWTSQDLVDLRSRFPKSELIALSSKDSARTALLCVRSGFADFLCKPVSPEEIAFSLKNAARKRAAVESLSDPRARLLQLVSEIVSCTTPTMVRLTVLRAMQEIFRCQGTAWISGRGSAARVVSALPADEPSAEILFRLPSWQRVLSTRRVAVFRSSEKEQRKVILPCQEDSSAAVFVWGVPGVIPRARLEDAHMVLRQGELALHNLTKLDEARRSSFVDDLTGLYNSRYLRYALAAAVQTARKRGTSFSVLFIDLDRFKAVNDTHGHLVGSDFLVAVSRTIKNAVRRADSVFRYGGDEFVVILQGAKLQSAFDVADRLRRRIEERDFLISDIPLRATVSVGVASYPETATDVDALMDLADQAMYAAKRSTRNAVHLAHPRAPQPDDAPRPARPPEPPVLT